MQVDQLIRSFAVVAAMFYVVGFLTANFYLYQLGVSDFSLLRTRFILTGVMVLAPLAFALAFGIYAAIDASVFERQADGFNRAWLWIVGDVLLPFALYLLLFSVVAENDAGSALLDAALLSVTCSIIVIVFLGSLAVHRRTDRHPVSHFFYSTGATPSWVLFSSRPGSCARGREDAKRGRVETTCADGKRRGWGLAQRRVEDPVHLDRLVLVWHLALWWLHALGRQVIKRGCAASSSGPTAASAVSSAWAGSGCTSGWSRGAGRPSSSGARPRAG